MTRDVSANRWPEHKLRLVDVGGAGGLHPDWLAHAGSIIPVLFEPNPAEATKLRETLAQSYPAGLVVETGLSQTTGMQALNIARYWGCTSLRKPNEHVLSKYRIGPIFDVVDTATVSCTRYDSLYHAGEVPIPDAIKIDVQGFEYEVLQGFGGLLQNCLAIELETHLYPIYRDQKLLHDLIGFLGDFGFVLRRLSPVPSFDGDVVELDAWFTKDRASWGRLGAAERAKFKLICDTWGLIDYAQIDPAGPHTQLPAVTSPRQPAEVLPAAASSRQTAEPPPYAILFKTHFWDDFVLRQLHRLQEQAGPGHVFLVLDETRTPIDAIDHPRILRMTERMSADAGYLWEPRGNLFWHNTDYQLYHFIDHFPAYQYIVTCEYDCVVNIPVSDIVETMAAQGLGFVGERIRIPPSAWHWAEFARPYYPEATEIAGRLLCFAAFSRDFALQLQAARRDHTRRFLAGEMGNPETGPGSWPNNEAFVGAEIARLNVPERPLSVFGSVARYDWAPPYPESGLARMRDSAVIHPVLDGRGQLRSMITKLRWNPEEVFQPGSHVRSYFEQCDPDHAVAMLLRHFAETKNWEALARLHGYAVERVGHRARSLFNVARGKPATQSSISPWSVWPDLARDAGGAVNGRITGGYGFHTHIDPPSWWCVDLQETYPVTEICIHNRLDVAFRSRSLVVTASTDMMNWQTLYRHQGDWDFGGADGAPLRISPPEPVHLRFLRLHLEAHELLHLDQVEVFI